MKHRLEFPQKGNGGWFIHSLDNSSMYLRRDGSIQDGAGYNIDNNGYWDTYDQAFKAREAYLSKDEEWTRPTFEEEYVGVDRYIKEKEDQAFEELEKKLEREKMEEKRQWFRETEGWMADDETIELAWNKKNQCKNNGGKTDYYQLSSSPFNIDDFDDFAEWRGMNGNQFNMGKVMWAFNVGRHNGTDYVRDLNKIIHYANRELDRLKREDVKYTWNWEK